MKKILLLALFILAACIAGAGCVAQTSTKNDGESTVSPTPSLSVPTSMQTTLPVNAKEGTKGRLTVSIGDYNAILPVLIDNISVGEVSPGKPLNINVYEGHRTVRVCSRSVCEQVDVEIKSAIKTSIDFEEWLKNNAPLGMLSISIGDFNGNLPVLVDNKSVGNVSSGKPLNISVIQGRHVVRVCSGSVCTQQDVDVTTTKPVTVDFGEQLIKGIPSGALTVSIGGYDAELPVLVDNTNVGVVSLGKPLDIMVSEGRHTVKVCVGVVCENESVEIKFAQRAFVGFGERLKKDVEFSTPTVRIVSSLLNVNRLTVRLEFINPEKIDHTMMATIGCGYSYIDSSTHERKNEFAQTVVTRSVKAGNRTIQSVDLSLSRGSTVIASEPYVVEVIVT